MLVAAGAVLVLGLSGCVKKVTQKAAERAAENAIEQSSGGKANVDLSNDTVTVNTDKGTYQAGGQVSLPAGFPDDIYVPDGQLTAAMSSTEDGGYSVSLTTGGSVAEVQQDFSDKLKDAGWEINLTMNYGGSAMVGANKGDDRTVSVSIASDDNGGVAVTIVTSTK